MTKEKFFVCSCRSHALHLMKFKNEDECYVSIWLNGHEDLGWKYKLRQIWQILKTGKPYGDEVVLTKDSALQLSKFVETLYARKGGKR